MFNIENTKLVKAFVIGISMAMILSWLLIGSDQIMNYSDVIPENRILRVQVKETGETDIRTNRPKKVYLVRWIGGFTVIPEEIITDESWRERLEKAARTGSNLN